MHLKLIDFIVRIFRLNHEQVLSDFFRIEYNWILKERDYFISIWVQDLIIQVNSFHNIRMQTIEENFL